MEPAGVGHAAEPSKNARAFEAEFRKRTPIFERVETNLRCAGVDPKHLSLSQLAPGDCRYPYGGDTEGEIITFCGHRQRLGSSYCPAHFDLSRGPGTTAERAALVPPGGIVVAA